MRGARYEIDLDSPSLDTEGNNRTGLLRDIKEREHSDVKPVPPTGDATTTGFPTHTKKRLSRFKRQGGQATKDETAGSLGSAQAGQIPMPGANDTEAIDRENKQRLASMSEAEIFREQEDLQSHLSPTLIKLLRGRAARPRDQSPPASTPNPMTPADSAVNDASSSPNGFGQINAAAVASSPNSRVLLPSESLPSDPTEAGNVTQDTLHSLGGTVHFPKPPKPPELDLHDPDFNEKLHSAYFPALPTEPSSLSWMEPITDEERAEYSPASQMLAVSALRFDFKGRLISPRRARQIPVNKGLHHHGDAPESAGYTIPELTHLARSVIPGQRCIAYQTLGRILYRLGQGEYHREGDDLYEGLWELVEKSKILDDMIQVAARENEGPRSVWAYATDAVHLWRKGGGKRWQGR